MSTIITLSALGVITMFLGVFNKKNIIIPVVFFGLILALVFSAINWTSANTSYSDMIQFDGYASAFSSLLILGTFLIFLIARHYFIKIDKPMEDIYAVLIFSLVGSVVMTMFNNLTMLFVGLEIMSVSLYILTGSKKTSPASNEAAMKYFLLGTFFTGILLFGIALIYGVTGSFDLKLISDWVNANQNQLPLIFKAGVLLITIAMAFKIAAFPFHFWAPDVYHGAPTLITAFMATVVKIAGIAAFYKLFTVCFSAVYPLWGQTLWYLTLFTILFGNLAAIFQSQVKRMLAYSSIAHTGYIMMALVAHNPNTVSVLIYYSLAYMLSTIGAFAVLMLVREGTKDGSILAFEGLAKENKFLSFAMTISLLSLTGIPPLAGFMGKYYLFSISIDSGNILLTIFAILGSAISVVYYFKIIIAMYMKPGDKKQIAISSRTMLLLILLTILIIFTGLLPETFLTFM